MPEDSNEMANVEKFLWDERWFSRVLRDPHQIMQQNDRDGDDSYQW